jgi:hypothetical protein
VIDVPADAERDLARRLVSELGQQVTGWSPIAGGAQNRLFRLDTEDGAALVAKFYHRDRWQRLEHEFTTLACLNRIGLAHVPRALLRSDEHNYAVLSFEPGSAKAAAELQPGDMLRVAVFAADLHAVAPDDLSCDVPLAVEASFRVSDQLAVIHARSSAADVPKLDIRARLAELIARTTQGVDLTESLPRSAWRINSADFGPQNLLFTPRSGLTALDFEAGGWDDPARLVMGFVAHAASEELVPGAACVFLRAYADARKLSDAEMRRFERVGLLLDLEWVAIYTSALSAEAVAAKQFAMRDLDRDTYVQGVLDKLRRRLSRAEQMLGYRF